MTENKILQFEPFKKAKKWDDEYIEFLGNIEKYFKTKTNPEAMTKRLYFALRYLEGIVNSFWIFNILGINKNDKEFKKGRKYCIGWLEEILKKLKDEEK